jgi:hypothetical protein
MLLNDVPDSMSNANANAVFEARNGGTFTPQIACTFESVLYRIV